VWIQLWKKIGGKRSMVVIKQGMFGHLRKLLTGFLEYCGRNYADTVFRGHGVIPWEADGHSE